MHICFLTNEYPKEGFPHGGIGSFVKTIAPVLVSQGISVSVVGVNYTNHSEYVEENGVMIYRLAHKKIKGLSWHFAFKAVNDMLSKIHQKYPIDIVEGSELGLAFVKKQKDIKYVIRLHGGHHFFAEAENRGINFWKGFQEKLSFKKADGFIAVSDFVKQHTQKYLSYNEKPVEIINYPINTDFFSPSNKQAKKYSIVFAGTVCEKKGVRQLIQSFYLVQEKYPEAELHIYGRDWYFKDGTSYTDMLKRMELPKLGASAENVYFHGTVSYELLPDKYAEAHVCVFPSHMETQGLVAPEAMAMNKTVIFTNKGPGPETISDYETGLLCDPLNPIDIADKIIWVFENDQRAREIGRKARGFVINKFGLTYIIDKNRLFYQRLKDV